MSARAFSSSTRTPRISRRHLVGAAAGACAFLALPAVLRAQKQPDGDFSHLHGGKRTGLPPEAIQQRVSKSAAPAAADMGGWTRGPSLLLPRSEMAWATAWQDRLHLVGGYGEGRVSNPYHHVYAADGNRWTTGPALPRAGNHVGVVAADGLLYAIGGHRDQNRDPYTDCFVLDLKGGATGSRWRRIAPLPRARGAISVVAVGGQIHAIGGAIGNSFPTKRSVDWHEVYDPKADRWARRARLPVARDHMGAVVIGDAIHVIGGRIHNASHNVGFHDVYLTKRDRWVKRAPLPTARSGHGAVLYRGRIFVMGGEEFMSRSRGPDGRMRLHGLVFAQNESYDPKTNSWLHHAPMPTARHGLGAAVVGDAIHVVGGGPVVGGSVQSAVHEVFRLG